MNFSNIHFFTVVLCDFMIDLAIVNLFLPHPLGLYYVNKKMWFLKMYFAKYFIVTVKGMITITFYECFMKLNVPATSCILELDLIDDDL